MRGSEAGRGQRSRLVASWLLLASGLAAAQTPSAPQEPAAQPQAGWRGTSVSYAVEAQVRTVGHVFGFSPEWHFNRHFAARARLFAAATLTFSDTLSRPGEFALSDVFLDGVYTGWTEPHTGLRLAGELRLSLPTSRLSWVAARALDLAPLVAVSRELEVLGGLSLSYSARFTTHLGHITDAPTVGQLWGLPATSAASQPVATFVNFDSDRSTLRFDWAFPEGPSSALFDVLHGASANLNLSDRWSVTAVFLLRHTWLVPLAPAPPQFASSTQLTDPGPRTRDTTTLLLAVSFQPVKPLGFSLAGATLGQLPLPSGGRSSSFFNAYTWLSLTARVDLEAAASGLMRWARAEPAAKPATVD